MYIVHLLVNELILQMNITKRFYKREERRYALCSSSTIG